jgi:ABC-type branched-subunit amino acid transport system substrate-binding protein
VNVRRAVLVAVLWSTVALAGRTAVPDVVEDALAYATTDRHKAIALLEEALASGPAAGDVDAIALHAGEQHRLAGDALLAETRFSEVDARDPHGTWGDAARLGLVLLESGTKPVDDRMRAVLEDTPDKDVLDTQNADRHLVLAREAARRDDTTRAANHAKKALAYAKEDPELHARVRATLELAASGAAVAATEVVPSGPVDRNRIVALVPLSGKYEAVGTSVRDALSFGYGSAPRELVFVDSGATGTTAVVALEEAVADGAIAVVGPLLADETAPVVDAAERLGVPLLSLSQSYEDNTGHRWALPGMYTRVDQIEALLEFAMGERGMQAFHVFHPDNAFGTHATELFTAAVARRGGTIRSSASYAADEQNLIPYAQKLGDRSGNLSQIRRDTAAAGGDPGTSVLPPKVDFDAIFLPESAQRTPLACAALAYEEFPMGEFSPQQGGPKRPLLGLSSWNTTTLVTQGNEYTRNSLFPDVFAASAAGADDPFVAAYRDATTRTPTALEAAAVDLGHLLALAARSDADTRAGFRDALLAAAPTDTVTGLVGFDDTTLRMERRMLILTITRTTIEKVGEVTLNAD